MTRPLADIVADAYKVFSRYQVGSDLAVCYCTLCMTKHVERELVTTPLREIAQETLAEYTNSAHEYDDGRVATELRYFLPRYLELISIGQPPDNLGLDICLRRLGFARYRETWPTSEAAILDEFFEALAAEIVELSWLVDSEAGPFAAFDIADILTLTVTAGGDLERVLAAWESGPDPAATLHMAEARTHLYPVRDELLFWSPYLDDHVFAKRQIAAWLTRPAVLERIERAFFETNDPRLQAVLSRGLGGR